jgi:hypothetical protein
MNIEPTTPLGYISAQHIVDAIANSNVYALDNLEENTSWKVVVEEPSIEHEAVSLFEIHAPEGMEPTDEDMDILCWLLIAEAERTMPTVASFLEEGAGDEAQREYNKVESKALEA